MNPALRKVIVDRALREARDEDREKCICAITATIVADLMDFWGWTTEQVTELLGNTSKNFEAMLEGFVTIQDYIDWLNERNIIIDVITNKREENK